MVEIFEAENRLFRTGKRDRIVDLASYVCRHDVGVV